jgi:membrane protein DedA with SNARE-associated domain
MVLYFFGYTKGRLFFQKYNRSYFKLEYLMKIESWFQRWGNLILILSRVVAGVRSLIAITAGIAKVPAPRMTFFTLISFCLWYGILIGGMYLVKSNWLELVRLIKSYEMLVIFFSAIIVTIWLVIIYRRNRVKG